MPEAGPPDAAAGPTAPAGTAPPSPAGARGRADRGPRPVRIAGPHLVVVARPAPDAASPRLMMAVPKKLVPSSPVRNLIRRVVREAHRAASRDGALSALSVRVQLAAVPVDPAAPASGPNGRALRPFARRPTDGALKRAVRAEADGLLGRLAARRPLPADGRRG